MWRRVLLVLFTVTAVFTVTAAPAAAIDFPSGTDCLHPPTPASPNGGLAGWIDPGPDKPAAGDPWAPGSTVTIYSQYGYAGLDPIEFDPGCVSVASWNSIASGFSLIAATVTAVTVRLYRTVMTGTFGSLFDGIQDVAGRAFGHGLFVPLIGFAVACTGLALLVRARKADLAGQAKVAVTSLLIIAGGVACVFYPIAIGKTIDEGVTNTITDVNSIILPAANGGTPGDPGRAADMIAANIHVSILYEAWRQQTFGPDGTAAADEFGPRLFAAAAFTRAEQAAIDANPTTAADSIRKKQDDYKAVAKQVQDKYPQAYVHLAGGDTLTTMGVSWVGVVSALVACAFLIYALWRFAFALIIARVGLAVAPIVALVAQFPRYQSTAMRLVGAVVSAAVTAIVLGIAAVAYLVGGIAVILSPATHWHPVLKILALLALTVVLMKLLSHLGLAGKGLKAKKKKGSKGEPGKSGEGSPPSETSPETPPATADSTPPPRTARMTKGAVDGAGSAAVQTAAVGAATGGTVTVGALAAGAAKGGAAGAVSSAPAPAPARDSEPPVPLHRPTPDTPGEPPALTGPQTRAADTRITERGASSRVVEGQTIFHPGSGRVGAEPPGPEQPAGTSTVNGVPVHRVTTVQDGTGW
jgi:MFS family permease